MSVLHTHLEHFDIAQCFTENCYIRVKEDSSPEMIHVSIYDNELKKVPKPIDCTIVLMCRKIDYLTVCGPNFRLKWKLFA
ncbi:unnamed protein product [Rhizopus stolonifer]